MNRNIIWISLFLSLLINIKTKSCDLSNSCINKQFPYWFCDEASGSRITRCSANPYNEFSNGNLIKPFKFKMNINCLNYDESSFKYPQFKEIFHHEAETTYVNILHDIEYGRNSDNKIIYGWRSATGGCNTSPDEIDCLEPFYTREIDEIKDAYDETKWFDCIDVFNEGNTVVFNSSDIAQVLRNALLSWTSKCDGCNLNDTYIRDCCSQSNIKVYWSDVPSDFKAKGSGATSIASVTSSYNCNTPCSQLYIKLNQSNDFTGATEDEPCNYNKHFFFTGNQGKYNWKNLETVLKHEIGHLLGFPDQYLYNDGTNAMYASCFDNDSRMSNKGFFDDNSPVLTDDDICMYKKLYCSSLTDVEESHTFEQGVKIFPNPVNSDFINLQFGNPEFKRMSYEIISQIGSTVLKGEILPEDNPKTIVLKDMPNGSYVLILNSNGAIESKKFVVNK